MRQAQLERFGVHYCHPTPHCCSNCIREDEEALVLATSKSGTHWEPRDQGLDGGLVSSLRALL